MYRAARRYGEFWLAFKSVFTIQGLLTILVTAVFLTSLLLLHQFDRDLQAQIRSAASAPEAIVFLSPAIGTAEIDQLHENFQAHPQVQAVALISASEGLAMLREQPHLDSIIAELTINPLPPVLRLRLRGDIVDTSQQQQSQLKQQWRDLDGVEDIEIEVHSHRQIRSWATTLQYLFTALLILLGVSVIGMYSISMRRCPEISARAFALMRLMGARRSYLIYRLLLVGWWHGFSGWLIAIGMVWMAHQFLPLALNQVSPLGTLGFSPAQSLDWSRLLPLLAIVIAVVLLGVASHLRTAFKTPDLRNFKL